MITIIVPYVKIPTNSLSYRWIKIWETLRADQVTKFSYANSRYACAARPLNDVFTRSVRAYTDHTYIKTTAPRLWCKTRLHEHVRATFVEGSDTRRRTRCVYTSSPLRLSRGSWIAPLPSWTSFRVNNGGRIDCCPEHTHPFSTLFITSRVQTHARTRLEIVRTIRIEIDCCIFFFFNSLLWFDKY